MFSYYQREMWLLYYCRQLSYFLYIVSILEGGIDFRWYFSLVSDSAGYGIVYTARVGVEALVVFVIEEVDFVFFGVLD